MVNVICMKWGDKYGPEYVNRLYGMVARNLTRDFRFVCFTDDGEGVRDEVEIRPLPSLNLPAGLPERGWMKLTTFAEFLADLHGTTLFLDLDVVIVDNIDCFFEIDGDFRIAFDKKKAKEKVGNSSVYRFEIGRHQDVLEYFQDHFEEIRGAVRNEQAYLSNKMNEKGVLQFWPEAWCPSFKYHCVPKFPLNLWKAPEIPHGAKIVLFHGKPEPEEAARGISGKWYRYFKPVEWIERFWQA